MADRANALYRSTMLMSMMMMMMMRLSRFCSPLRVTQLFPTVYICTDSFDYYFFSFHRLDVINQVRVRCCLFVCFLREFFSFLLERCIYFGEVEEEVG